MEQDVLIDSVDSQGARSTSPCKAIWYGFEQADEVLIDSDVQHHAENDAESGQVFGSRVEQRWSGSDQVYTKKLQRHESETPRWCMFEQVMIVLAVIAKLMEFMSRIPFGRAVSSFGKMILTMLFVLMGTMSVITQGSSMVRRCLSISSRKHWSVLKVIVLELWNVASSCKKFWYWKMNTCASELKAVSVDDLRTEIGIQGGDVYSQRNSKLACAELISEKASSGEQVLEVPKVVKFQRI